MAVDPSIVFVAFHIPPKTDGRSSQFLTVMTKTIYDVKQRNFLDISFYSMCVPSLNSTVLILICIDFECLNICTAMIKTVYGIKQMLHIFIYFDKQI